MSDKGWTIVLPIRDTDDEYEFMKKSLKSAFKLNPPEIILGLDLQNDTLPVRIVERAIEMKNKYNYTGNMRVIAEEKTKEWGFQLAKILWSAYGSATYNKILSFDVDSIVLNNVMLGYPDIGKNNVAVLSFTKRLRTNNIQELIRYVFYRIRVFQSDNVFSGVYWVYKPYFFDTINLDAYKKIKNGVDTILITEVTKQKKYKLITRKEKGVECMTIQNEDIPWRQFQTGVWIAANEPKWYKQQTERRNQMLKLPKVQIPKIPQFKTLKQRIGLAIDASKKFDMSDKQHWKKAYQFVINTFLMYRWLPKKLLKGLLRRTIRLNFNFIISIMVMFTNWQLFSDNASAARYIFIKRIVYQHPYLLKGFNFALQNPNHDIVKLAKTMSAEEWGYLGSTYFTNLIEWKHKGTGFVENDK